MPIRGQKLLDNKWCFKHSRFSWFLNEFYIRMHSLDTPNLESQQPVELERSKSACRQRVFRLYGMDAFSLNSNRVCRKVLMRIFACLSPSACAFLHISSWNEAAVRLEPL